MATGSALLVAALLFPASAVKLSVQDQPESEEQVLSPKAVFEDSAPSCECLNWKETYATQEANCGDGMEFHWARKTGTPRAFIDATHYDRLCTHFFQRMNDNKCVLMDLINASEAVSSTRWDAQSWCYVSADCFSPNTFKLNEGLARRNGL